MISDEDPGGPVEVEIVVTPEVTPEMIEAGVDAFHSFGGSEDLAATDSGLVVREIFEAMAKVARSLKV